MANDFSGLPAGSIVLNMDDGDLTGDAMGGNDWTDNNTVGQSVDAPQGDRSGEFDHDNDESLSIADGDLAAGAALKVGNTVKEITVCMWVKFESFAESVDRLFSKWLNAGKRSLGLASVWIGGTDYKLHFYLGYNDGNSSETVNIFGTTFATAIWYHIALTYQDSDKAWKNAYMGR